MDEVPWHSEAACKPVSGKPDLTHLFYDEKQVSRARAICFDCPVREACLEDAFRTRDFFGMRAGLTPRNLESRYRILRRQRKIEHFPKPRIENHGTRREYNQGCRCPLCERAQQEGLDQLRENYPTRTYADERRERREAANA